MFGWRSDAFQVGGCLAAISLCLNVSSPFIPRPIGGRRRPGPPPRDEPAPPRPPAGGAPERFAGDPYLQASPYVQAVPYGPRPLPQTGPPGAMGALARVFWWGSSALFLATSLSL